MSDRRALCVSPDAPRSTRPSRTWRASVACALALWGFLAALALGQTSATRPSSAARAGGLDRGPERAVEQTDARADSDRVGFFEAGPPVWTSPQGISQSLKIVLLLTVLSLAPAIVLMTTSFVRIVVVLGLLRHAMGTQQLPPTQVLTSLALFMTFLVMAPTWKEAYEEGIRPYSDPDVAMSLSEAWERTSRPIRRFMARQIDAAGNQEDVYLFLRHMPEGTSVPKTYDDVPLQVLLPAYMLSELKVAFLIGFQVYLPFLILDLVVASVTISMGMLMLPPTVVSLPFKLMVFVLADGWRLVVEMLLVSFSGYG